jgi:uncharacterized protein YjiS (DUF1127 family)
MRVESEAPFDWAEFRIALASASRARIAEALRKFKRWIELGAERRALGRLDQRALKDIGLSRTDALREAERPFWDDAPSRRFD